MNENIHVFDILYVCNSMNVNLNSFKLQPCESVSCSCLTEVQRELLAWFSLPSRPFSTTTLMKWSCLTNTSRASREPRLLPAAATTERLNGNEYQQDPCCSFHSLLFSLFHTLCVSADSSTLLRWCDLTLQSGWDMCHISRLTVWQQQNLSNAQKQHLQVFSLRLFYYPPIRLLIFSNILGLMSIVSP